MAPAARVLSLLAIAAALAVGAPASAAEAQGRPLFVKLVDEDSGAAIEGEVRFEERIEQRKPGTWRPGSLTPMGYSAIVVTRWPTLRIMADAKDYGPKIVDVVADSAAAGVTISLLKITEVVVEVRGSGGVVLRDAVVTFADPERMKMLEEQRAGWKALGLGEVVEPWHLLDGQGRHVLRNVDRGTRKLRVVHPGYLTAEPELRVPQSQLLMVDLVAAPVLDVAVEGTKEKSVRALVRVQTMGNKGRGTEGFTDEDGRARLVQAKSGKYRVWAEAEDGRNSKPKGVTVEAGKPAVVRLLLP